MDLKFTDWASNKGILNGRRLDAMWVAETSKDWRLACSAFGLEGQDIVDMHSSYKSLDRRPFNDKALTHQGIHVARYVFANYYHVARKKSDFLSDTVPWPFGHPWEAGLFDKDGLVILNDFKVPSKYIDDLNRADPSISKQPSNMFTGKIPNLRSLIEACIGTSASPHLEHNTFYQVIENTEDDNDEQKDYHCDTFFPALKFWYFPSSVSATEGPLVYVKNSNEINTKRLDWLYEQTVSVVDGSWDKSRRRGHPEGSFRVTDIELFEMNLHACPVPVEANTLVIANVGGFHGRGDANGRHTRRAIHGSVRISDPFS